jgi:competence protein ComFC
MSAGRNNLRRMGAMLDLLFPVRCAACGAGDWPLCSPCAATVPLITPPLCERCGRPSEAPLSRCADCPPPTIDIARAPFLYDGPMARTVRALKFGGWRALAQPLAAAMTRAGGLEADCVTWVPLSRKRRAARGYDQAEVLARELARHLGLPVVPCLRRIRETSSQASRSGRDRRRALRGAFRAVSPVPLSVLLVDDVLTTGATAASCAVALRSAGASRVALVTAARSLRGAVPARCFDIIAAGSRLGLWLPGGSSPGSRCQPQAKRPT